MYVLGGPPSNVNPATNGEYVMLGPIAGLPTTQWQIDGTVFSLNQKLYFVYSGWPLNQTDASELAQELFITELCNATTAISPPVQISVPHEPWERSGDHGINEGPQFLSSSDGTWTGLAYSCAGSWTKDYKMNTLKYNGGDCLRSSSWLKSKQPLIQNSKRNGPFGPGHGSFINVDGETLAIYHATDRDDQGWDGRKARLQRMVWSGCGPEMGGCVGTLVRDPDGFMMNGTVGVGGAAHQEKRHSVRGMLKEAKERLRNL
jgi:GH43 family beta-xylosidase